MKNTKSQIIQKKSEIKNRRTQLFIETLNDINITQEHTIPQHLIENVRLYGMPKTMYISSKVLMKVFGIYSEWIDLLFMDSNSIHIMPNQIIMLWNK